MIYIFRKEMKKWHTVLWVVFVALALGSGISFWRHKGPHEQEIGVVNGEKIYFAQYRRALQDVQNRLNMLRPYAKLYGLSEEALFRNILGVNKPEDVALDTCVRDALLDQIVNAFNISVASSVFKEELLKSMPEGVTDENGYINMDVYQNYLSHMAMTPHEFEESRYIEIKRELVHKFIENAFYVPQFALRETYEMTQLKKGFVFVQLPFSRFLQEVEKEQVDENALKAYYDAHKEVYRLPERRKVRYWTIATDEYLQKVVVDDEAAKNFYAKNKSNLFRIPPKLKVRRIVCAVEKGVTAADAQKKAMKLLAEAKASPQAFAELAKKHSDDVTAKNGGVLDFFGRGTYDKAFEDAAFKLNAPGDLSPVVRTSKGFEIIQLVERKKAEEKPFEAVKDEIVKNLRVKKAISSLRADLEVMMHNARSDVAALETFVKQHQIEEKESEWLTTKNGETNDLVGMLAQKIFASVKRQQTYGYFILENKYVIYLLSGTEKSIIPSLEKVKGTVTADYQEQQADKNIQKTILQIKTDVLTKKMSLETVAGKYGVKISKTGMISSSDTEISGIEKDNHLTRKLFILSDPAQLLQHGHGHDYYLAQLLESEPFIAQSFDKEKDKIAKNQKMREQQSHVGAFIASLQRTAKINVDKKMLNKTMSMRD